MRTAWRPRTREADVFYETGAGDGHRTAGLAHNPLNALVVPRPIGWISSIDSHGVANLAPYSYFNLVSSVPPMVMFAANGPHAEGGAKDSVQNIRDTGEFVVNFVTADLMEAMNLTSAPAPRAIDEFALAGLDKAPSRLVRPPRVAASPIHLECRLHSIIELPGDPTTGNPNQVVFGTIVAVHISDELVADGRVDSVKDRPLGRMGYFDFTEVVNRTELLRPRWPLKP